MLLVREFFLDCLSSPRVVVYIPSKVFESRYVEPVSMPLQIIRSALVWWRYFWLLRPSNLVVPGLLLLLARLSNEVLEDLILQGSSRILVPQTPGIKIWSPQNSPFSSTFLRGPWGAKSCLLTVKLTNFSVQKNFGMFDPIIFSYEI